MGGHGGDIGDRTFNWGKQWQPKVKGHINYQLSWNSQHFFKGWWNPAGIAKRVTGNVAWIPGVAVGLSIYYWAQYKEDQIQRSHRF